MEDLHGKLYGRITPFNIRLGTEDTEDKVLSVVEKYQVLCKASGKFCLIGQVSFVHFVSGGRRKTHVNFDGYLNEHYGVHCRAKDMEESLEHFANFLMEELNQETADAIFGGYGRTLERKQEHSVKTEDPGAKLSFWKRFLIFFKEGMRGKTPLETR